VTGKAKFESLKSKTTRFLVVKFGSLGDIVHCLPSVAQLIKAFPNGEIDWLVERKNKVVVELSGLNVRLVPIDTYQWRNSPGIGSAKEIDPDRLGAGLFERERQPVFLYRSRHAETHTHHRSANGVVEAAGY
jgi:hypothetical protein